MEQLLNFVSWVLILVGIVEGILMSPPVSKFKNFLYEKKYGYLMFSLLSCRTCFSFWAAIGLSFLYFSPSEHIILDGFLGAGLFALISTFVDHCGQGQQVRPPYFPPPEKPFNPVGGLSGKPPKP